MSIAIVAHGRFHAFELAREFSTAGHHTKLFTNYPRFAVEPWGVPRGAIVSFPVNGAVGRIANRLRLRNPRFEGRWHEWFGRSAERAARRERWNAIICWSGVGEEIFRSSHVSGLRVCHRSSAHIRVQDRLLRQEGLRVGRPIEHPSSWIIAREEREYQLADVILVPSTFVRQSFVEMGVPANKIAVVPLGVDTSMFRPSAEIVEQRRLRILSGAPLRVAYVGALSLRKGLHDFTAVSRALSAGNFEFHATGPVAGDAREMVKQLPSHVTVHAAKPQRELPTAYADADLFIFPTVEDGFGMVVSQALAAAVPVVCTANCCGPDIVIEGETGWVVPAQSPSAFIDRLRWCDANRQRLAMMVRNTYERFIPRSWADTAADVIAELERHAASIRSDQSNVRAGSSRDLTAAS